MRGSVFSLEIFVAIAIAAMMGWLMLSYVDAQLDNTGYFAEFYAKDLATLADVTISGPGEVTILYDNLKALPQEFTIHKSVTVRAGDDYSVEQSRSFGIPEGVSASPYTGSPRFLAFSKRNDQFVVSEATGFATACEDVPRTRGLDYFIEVEESKYSLISGGMREAISPAFRNNSPVMVTNLEDADLVFEIKEDEQFRIVHASNKEDEYLACVIKSQLSAFTNKDVVLEDTGKAGTFVIHAGMDSKILGQTLGRSVVIYAR